MSSAIAHHDKVTHNKNQKGKMESTAVLNPSTEFQFRGGCSYSTIFRQLEIINTSTGEKVLCFHGPLLYQAKILNATVKDGQNRYLIHYMGWNEEYNLIINYLCIYTCVDLIMQMG